MEVEAVIQSTGQIQGPSNSVQERPYPQRNVLPDPSGSHERLDQVAPSEDPAFEVYEQGTPIGVGRIIRVSWSRVELNGSDACVIEFRHGLDVIFRAAFQEGVVVLSSKLRGVWGAEKRASVSLPVGTGAGLVADFSYALEAWELRVDGDRIGGAIGYPHRTPGFPTEVEITGPARADISISQAGPELMPLPLGGSEQAGARGLLDSDDLGIDTPVRFRSFSERLAHEVEEVPDAQIGNDEPVVRRRYRSTGPRTFEIRAHREKGEKVGLILGNTKFGAFVLSVQAGGLIDRWNHNNPHQMLRQGFIIESVNGAKGYFNILQEMRRPGAVTLKISSQPPPGEESRWFEHVKATARDVGKRVSESSFLLRLQPEDPDDASDGQFASLPCVRAAGCGVDQCAICLEDVAPHELLAQLPCQHAFHQLCVARWMARSDETSGNRQSCPLCCRRLVGTPTGVACVPSAER